MGLVYNMNIIKNKNEELGNGKGDDKYCYIIDIRLRQRKINLLNYIIDDNSTILSITPYSDYLLYSVNKKHFTFHDIILESEFNNIVLDEYKKIEKIFLDYEHYLFLMRDFALITTFEIYLKVLFDFLDKKKLEGYCIIYLTDAETAIDEGINDNKKSYIYNYKKIDKIIKIENKSYLFYQKNNFYSKIFAIYSTKNILIKIYNRFINKSHNKIELSYDNSNFKEIYENIERISLKKHLSINDVDNFSSIMRDILIDKKEISFIKAKYNNILNNFKKYVLNSSNVLSIKIHPFIFLHKMENYIEILLYGKNKLPKVFMQHGSYTIENLFLKFSEIYPANINFVFNDFTKSLFEKRGAKKVYSVGSIDFNYPIIEKKKKYDFLYITECTNYNYTGTYVSTLSNTISIDGNNIYQRHKNIIELFGTKFKDKKICIKIQPGIMLGTMLYIPFLELSKKYKNVTIEFSIPIRKLISKSKYIISDYFSSEFIHRELHYKRDIILFNSAPLVLPEEIVDDMQKIFILVYTVDDLKEKVSNIETITKDRSRYDDIIEYYSSKKCDTKEMVKEILEKELNART